MNPDDDELELFEWMENHNAFGAASAIREMVEYKISTIMSYQQMAQTIADVCEGVIIDYGRDVVRATIARTGENSFGVYVGCYMSIGCDMIAECKTIQSQTFLYWIQS